MNYHHNNKNRNAKNASYIHVQRDAVRTVPLNAPHRSRPTNGSYNKADVNKEPKLNLCAGEALTDVVSSCQWFAFLRDCLIFTATFSQAITLHHNILETSERISFMCSHAYDLKNREENLCWVQMTWPHTSLELASEHCTLFSLETFISPGRDCFYVVDIFLFY
jgi:hypothetical protein